MWARVWLALAAISYASSQQTHTRIQQNGATFEWGWQQERTPAAHGQASQTVGHYYVKSPQSEQRVQYSADSGGYHGAVAVNTSDGGSVHTANFALGQRALELSQSQPQGQSSNVTPLPQDAIGSNQPLEIFLLHQQYPSPSALNDQLIQLPRNLQTNVLQYTIPNYEAPTNQYYYSPTETEVNFNVFTQHGDNRKSEGKYDVVNVEKRNENESSKPLEQEDNIEHYDGSQSVVRVFKDHNCTNGDNENKTSALRTTKLYAQSSSYQHGNINGNFGKKNSATKRPLTYKGAVHFSVEPQRDNARSERYYYRTDPTPNSKQYNEEERIARLVASTQDLISNEDLLKINHAAEKQVNDQTDDFIRPRSRFSLRAEQTSYNQYSQPSTPNYEHFVQSTTPRYEYFIHASSPKYDIFGQSSTPRSKITVQAKVGKIVDSEIEHIENNNDKEKVPKTDSNEYKFASPIVVQDSSYDNFKEHIVNNLVSTMVPYLENGYEIVGVSDFSNATSFEIKEQNENSNYDYVDVTPRPISQKYLAPITVALRLLNANDTDSFNTIDDHEASDSEIVSETVEKPKPNYSKDKTIVEIQESVPVSITHINDVEHHEYLEEGRSNDKGPLDFAKALYNQYREVIENSKKYFENNHGSEENHNTDEKEKNNDTKEKLESSENIQTEVEVKPNDSGNERREFVRDYYGYDNQNGQQKIIQPIVIEKEVPVTQFVDRYIEKKVPYPETVEVRVPVDRPVGVPVPYEKIVEKPVEVTRYVDKPFPVEIPRPYPVEVKVPYPVEQTVFVDRPVHVPYRIDRLVEKQIYHQVPVPTPVAVPVEVQVPVERQVLYPVPIETPYPVPVEVEKPVTVERIVTQQVPVPYPVERKVPYPVPYETKVHIPVPVEKPVPYPVEKVVDRPVTVTKYIEKPVHIQVPVDRPVPVPQPYPVERVVEKKVHIPVPVDRIVEKKVPVRVPYPVEKIVEKIVEKPVVVTKYVDKPYPVEKRVPYAVEKIVEKPIPIPVRVPYVIEHPLAIYSYGYPQTAETQHHPQYLKYTAEQHKQGIPPPHLQKHQNIQHLQNQYTQYVQNLKDTEQKNNEQIQYLQNLYAQYYPSPKDGQQKNVQTTHWGNLYASSYQHINKTPQKSANFKQTPVLANYIKYVTNQNPSTYYGPPPAENYKDDWERNENYMEQMKLRRTDRMPKDLRIEYGFKPPLIPSIEVDLDGIPVKKDEEKQ